MYKYGEEVTQMDIDPKHCFLCYSSVFFCSLSSQILFTKYFQYRFLYLRLQRLLQNSDTIKFFTNLRHVWQHRLNIRFFFSSDTFFFPFVMSVISGNIASREITLTLLFLYTFLCFLTPAVDACSEMCLCSE